MSPEPGAKAKVDLKDALNRATVAIQRQLETTIFVVKERGLSRFGRILGLGAGAIFLSYALVYAPASKKLAGLDKRIATAKATAQFADRYKDIRQRIERVNSALPSQVQADGWLLDRVRETLNDRGLVPDSISPPTSRSFNGYIDQSVQFSIKAKFPDVIAWLNDLEFGKGIVQVTSLGIAKGNTDAKSKEADIGLNNVTCSVETLIPLGRARP